MFSLPQNLLDALGLTEDKGKVYLAALTLGTGSMQDLARRSGVKRTTIYSFIETLKDRGFVVETKKKKRKVYSAVDPSQLIEIEKTKMAELQKSLPELEAIFNASSRKPKVTYYEGMEGIKEVYGDMLKEKKPIFAYEDLEHMKASMPKSFYDYFPPERARRGIPLKSISRDSAIAREFVKNNDRLLRETRFLVGDDFKTEINIYGDKVAMMSFRVHPPLCVLIQDENIAKTLRLTWQELWNRL